MLNKTIIPHETYMITYGEDTCLDMWKKSVYLGSKSSFRAAVRNAYLHRRALDHREATAQVALETQRQALWLVLRLLRPEREALWPAEDLKGFLVRHSGGLRSLPASCSDAKIARLGAI